MSKPVDTLTNAELVAEFVGYVRAARLSQNAASALAGVGQSVVSEWKRGIVRALHHETRDKLEQAVERARKEGGFPNERALRRRAAKAPPNTGASEIGRQVDAILASNAHPVIKVVQLYHVWGAYRAKATSDLVELLREEQRIFGEQSEAVLNVSRAALEMASPGVDASTLDPEYAMKVAREVRAALDQETAAADTPPARRERRGSHHRPAERE